MSKDFYNGRDFWIVDDEVNLSYPINEEIIKKAEERLHVKLPKAFIELMKIQNGGDLTYPQIMLPACDEESFFYDEDVSIPYIYPIHFKNDDISIVFSLNLLEDMNLPDKLVVLWTDFHYWLVLDYRDKDADPPVLYIAENFMPSASNTTTWEFIKVADTFDEFLGRLYRSAE
ncbi:SMI1/KNR4 family protein [Bacillus sp. F19]|nr:SMI1/KNR4 family protein [Bacillus sp. F19]